ncbi:MAG: hypothetical protein HQL15_10555 [Candidatus Omnitrophica bacterium]|nr:hypothetical protein [Candidatus Omnitrophota bacterium]
MEKEHISEMREMDRWLRKAAFIGTAISFIAGYVTGGITSYLFYKDWAIRTINLENSQFRQDERIEAITSRQNVIVTIIEDRFHIRIP